MSVPTIKALKSKKCVFAFIPSGFLGPIIDILVYAFGDDQQSFNDILKDFKRAFSHFFESIQRTQLVTLLHMLGQRLINHDNKWFKNL